MDGQNQLLNFPMQATYIYTLIEKYVCKKLLTLQLISLFFCFSIFTELLTNYLHKNEIATIYDNSIHQKGAEDKC